MRSGQENKFKYLHNIIDSAQKTFESFVINSSSLDQEMLEQLSEATLQYITILKDNDLISCIDREFDKRYKESGSAFSYIDDIGFKPQQYLRKLGELQSLIKELQKNIKSEKRGPLVSLVAEMEETLKSLKPIVLSAETEETTQAYNLEKKKLKEGEVLEKRSKPAQAPLTLMNQYKKTRKNALNRQDSGKARSLRKRTAGKTLKAIRAEREEVALIRRRLEQFKKEHEEKKLENGVFQFEQTMQQAAQARLTEKAAQARLTEKAAQEKLKEEKAIQELQQYEDPNQAENLGNLKEAFDVSGIDLDDLRNSSVIESEKPVSSKPYQLRMIEREINPSSFNTPMMELQNAAELINTFESESGLSTEAIQKKITQLNEIGKKLENNVRILEAEKKLDNVKIKMRTYNLLYNQLSNLTSLNASEIDAFIIEFNGGKDNVTKESYLAVLKYMIDTKRISDDQKTELAKYLVTYQEKGKGHLLAKEKHYCRWLGIFNIRSEYSLQTRSMHQALNMLVGPKALIIHFIDRQKKVALTRHRNEFKAK